jgi:alkylhydroperoxidase/carboxymuconolactone decarboxylase family protein YurZ
MAVPKAYTQFKKRHPRLVKAYEQLSDETRAAGPLDLKTIALVKLALAVGAGLEGATHSAARKALAARCTADQMLHTVVLATTTLGFPAMMRARSWVLDVLDRK